MAFKLSRDPALTVPLLSTYGAATLLGKDGQEVQVALAPLLGASSLVRSVVTSSQLHPEVNGYWYSSTCWGNIEKGGV